MSSIEAKLDKLIDSQLALVKAISENTQITSMLIQALAEEQLEDTPSNQYLDASSTTDPQTL